MAVNHPVGISLPECVLDGVRIYVHVAGVRTLAGGLAVLADSLGECPAPCARQFAEHRKRQRRADFSAETLIGQVIGALCVAMQERDALFADLNERWFAYQLCSAAAGKGLSQQKITISGHDSELDATGAQAC